MFLSSRLTSIFTTITPYLHLFYMYSRTPYSATIPDSFIPFDTHPIPKSFSIIILYRSTFSADLVRYFSFHCTATVYLSPKSTPIPELCTPSHPSIKRILQVLVSSCCTFSADHVRYFHSIVQPLAFYLPHKFTLSHITLKPTGMILYLSTI